MFNPLHSLYNNKVVSETGKKRERERICSSCFFLIKLLLLSLSFVAQFDFKQLEFFTQTISNNATAFNQTDIKNEYVTRNHSVYNNNHTNKKRSKQNEEFQLK